MSFLEFLINFLSISPIRRPPRPKIPWPTPLSPTLLALLLPIPTQRLRLLHPRRSRPDSSMDQIRSSAQAQPLQARRIQHIGLDLVVVIKHAIVFDLRVLVPVAVCVLERVDEPAVLLDSNYEIVQVDVHLAAACGGGVGWVELMFEVVDFDAGQVEVVADELAERRGTVCFFVFSGVCVGGGVEFADAEDVDEVEGAQGGGVGA